ncbi:malto-oligosyltrehalose trehalohydrolase [Singulisphaera rosea]
MKLEEAPQTSSEGWRGKLGAVPESAGVRFRVWAPRAHSVELVLESPEGRPESLPLGKADDGLFDGTFPEVRVGDRYRYRVDDNGPFPDPASRFQPEGVHGPSEVVDPGTFRWSDHGWKGIGPDELVVYELHVGTFTKEGTFLAAIDRLPALRDLGVTAVELMPVADFSGVRSWGYDGVDLFAPSRCYGRPEDLRRLVDEAHRLGLAVLLDVVYNHFGPVGNYTGAFSPNYLSTTHQNAWGSSVNLDGDGSSMVREFFVENALHWVHEYHIDGLRLDATHALVDDGPQHFVAELTERVRSSSPDRRILVIAEDHRNLATMVRPSWAGGWDLDGVWADDFHHQVRRLLAGDNEGYYRDYTGTIPDLVDTINLGWFYCGEHSVHLDEPRGTDPVQVPPRRFVTCLQNHDQIGNRAFGERLHHQVDQAAYRAASALLLVSPATPMLFMGQEWAATSPFLFFTDHDEDLGKLVTEGRRREFRHFMAFIDPEARERIPDPQSPSTFERSRLDWSEVEREPHASTLRLYKALLKLRRNEPALRSDRRENFKALPLDDGTLLLLRADDRGGNLILIARLRGAGVVDLQGNPDLHFLKGRPWEVVLTTEDPAFVADPHVPTIERDREMPRIRFDRASAIIVRVDSYDSEG